MSRDGDELDMSGSESTRLLQGQSADSTDDSTHARVIRVPDSLPASAWLIAIIEACERFAYFGVTGPLQNYIQNPSGDPLLPGSLGQHSHLPDFHRRRIC